MFLVALTLSTASLFYIIDSAQAAAEEKLLEQIVEEARARAKKAASNIEEATAGE
ncbi:MAG: hypothetical protein ACP5G4_05005 [bacterium]